MARKAAFQRFVLIMPDADTDTAKPIMPYGLAVDMCLQIYKQTEGDIQAMLTLGKAIFRDFRVHSPNEPKGWDQFVSCLRVSAKYEIPPIETGHWPTETDMEYFYYHDPEVLAAEAREEAAWKEKQAAKEAENARILRDC